jgi:formylglycine-generating enzyme required for sulfatase activity
LERAGWVDDNSGGETHPVAQKTPNNWGLYDMHGNVREWCWDAYCNYSPGNVTNPDGAGSGSFRVIRGGAWRSNAWDCRSAYRGNSSPSRIDYGLGFRFVRSAGL